MAREKITKNEAVRLALVELGPDAPRGRIQGFVKERFGYEMTPNHVSAARVAAVRKLAAGKKPEASTPRPAASSSNGKSAISVDDILTLKDLVKRIGPTHLRTLIDVIAK